MVTCTRLFLVASLCAFTLIGTLASSAQAENSEEVTALVAELAAATKARDGAAAATAFKKVAAAYKGCDDKAQRGKLLAGVAKAMKSKHLGDSRTHAVVALLSIDDAKAAWKVLSKAMPNPKKVDEATELQLAVTAAAGKLAQSRAIKPLIEIANKAKDTKLAAVGALALGGYREDKKNRVMVLEELIRIGKRARPGQIPGHTVSAEIRARWQTVSSAIVTALNALTNQDFSNFEEWVEAHKADKKKPAVLFVEQDE